MDKQGRLTRKDEWEVGASYQWLKGGKGGPVRRFLFLDGRGVVLKNREAGCSGTEIVLFWRNRWRKVSEKGGAGDGR